MKDTIKIAIVGLGQVGNYLYNELKIKQAEETPPSPSS